MVVCALVLVRLSPASAALLLCLSCALSVCLSVCLSLCLSVSLSLCLLRDRELVAESREVVRRLCSEFIVLYTGWWSFEIRNELWQLLVRGVSL
jgi:hypothetical protein